MKKILLSLSVVLSHVVLSLAVVLAAVSCGPRFEPFTFVHMADTQVGFFDYEPGHAVSDTLMARAVRSVNELNPDLVVICGDLVDHPDTLEHEEIFSRNLAKFIPETWLVPGNHDYMSYNRPLRDRYLAQRGYERFYFVHKGCAFIGMDSNCIKEGVEDAEAEQLEWLKARLAEASKCKHVFIFMHCPIIRQSIDEPEDYFNFPVSKRQQYIDLFKASGVTACFFGHCHQEWRTEYEGIKFLTAGSVCRALGHGYPGYGIIKVTEDGIEESYFATPVDDVPMPTVK